MSNLNVVQWIYQRWRFHEGKYRSLTVQDNEKIGNCFSDEGKTTQFSPFRYDSC